jgi:hypothetical protein
MIRWGMVAFVALAAACGGGGSTYSDKCKLACDPSAVTACAMMDPSMCQHDCEAFTSGLTATCATCVTGTNAWTYAVDYRMSGQPGCHGYAFPSLTDSSSTGCASFCK